MPNNGKWPLALKHLVIWILAAALAMPALAAEAADAKILDPPYVVDLEKLDYRQGFGEIEWEMRYLISQHGDPGEENHFCILAYPTPQGKIEADIYWEEGPSIIYGWPGSHAEIREHPGMLHEFRFDYANSMFFSLPTLYLNKPIVVFTRQGGVDDLHPGVYFGAANGIGFHTFEEVSAVIADCQRRGKQYVIPPFAVGRTIYEDGEVVARLPLERLYPFAYLETELRYLIARLGDPGTENHFCAVGYELRDTMNEAVVIWKEGHRLFRWYGTYHYAVDEKLHPGSLFESSTLDLATGEIANQNENVPEIGMATRAQVEGTQEDCEKHGRQVVILPFTPPPDWENPLAWEIVDLEEAAILREKDK
jgi:hypothetical protein